MKFEKSRETPNRHFVVLSAVGAAGIAVCAAAVAVTLSETQSSNPVLEAEARSMLIAAPIAVGLYFWYRDPWTRFAKLLVAAGFVLSLTTLGQSGNEVLYSVGRISGWFVEPLLIYLVLAFPSGRLTTPPRRRLVGASVLLVAVLFLPTALLVDSYPAPSPWSSCAADCPSNAFMLLDSEPGFVENILLPLRDAAAIVLFAGVVAVLAASVKSGTHLMRITLAPVLTLAIVHALAAIAAIVARRADPDGAATEVLVTLVALSSVGITLGFLVGLWGWRLFENRTLRRLATEFAAHRPALSVHETSELLADAMDPSLEVLSRPRNDSDGWLDGDGRPSRSARNGGLRCMTEISAENGRVVGVLHDAALRDAPTFLAVVRSSVLKALENERLEAQLQASLRELRESRARIMSSADRERQRIERDLHDGAQQSLVALRIRLELASQLLGKNPTRAESLLSELATEVDKALEEVRSLARGVYPSLLADRGLADAVRAAALRCPVPTTVDTDGVARYRPEIEASAYFCCLEAMQNAMKHAAGVKTISISLAAEGDLRFEVRDDGAGFAEEEVTSGAGLTSMRDRLAAVGGLLTIRTAPGSGTCVSGIAPINEAARRGASEGGPRFTGRNGRRRPVEPGTPSLAR